VPKYPLNVIYCKCKHQFSLIKF